MFVVLDSNIWISEIGLRSSVGSATKLFLRSNDAQLVLPEVVRLEVEYNLHERLTGFITNIADSHRQLLAIFGTLKEVVLPSSTAVKEKVASVFEEIGVPVVEVPFTMNSARDSLLKAIAKRAPSDKAEQFRDGVIWADCKHLLDKGDVRLVSDDRAFYEGRDYKQGLASSLRSEIIGSAHTLTLLPDLSSLLKGLKREVAISDNALERAFFEKFNASIMHTLNEHGFTIARRVDAAKTVFATEDPRKVYVEFTLQYDCDAAGADNRTQGQLILRGDGQYLPEDRTFVQLRNHGEDLRSLLPDGSEGRAKNVVAHLGGIVLGHREVSHAVRYKLD